MVHVEKSINIHAPINKVYDYILDPGHSPEWIKNMESVSDITGHAKGDHYHWTYRMAGIIFDGDTEIIDQEPNRRQVVHSSGGIDSTWTFNFMENGEEDTRLDLAIDYTVPVPVLGKMAEKLILKQNEKEAEESLKNLRNTLEH